MDGEYDNLARRPRPAARQKSSVNQRPEAQKVLEAQDQSEAIVQGAQMNGVKRPDALVEQ